LVIEPGVQFNPHRLSVQPVGGYLTESRQRARAQPEEPD
jgi:hypothetical protein